MNTDEIALIFTVGVGHDASKPSNDGRGPSTVGTKINSFRIVVIGVNVVPDHRIPFEHLVQLF